MCFTCPCYDDALLIIGETERDVVVGEVLTAINTPLYAVQHQLLFWWPKVQKLM